MTDEKIKLEYVQTILTRDELEELLRLSGKRSKKDALREAVLYFIRSRRG